MTVGWISLTCRRHAKFIALMPQWDFLNFLAGKGKAYPRFHLRMEVGSREVCCRKTAGCAVCEPRRRPGRWKFTRI